VDEYAVGAQRLRRTETAIALNLDQGMRLSLSGAKHDDAMTPEEALNNILKLVEGSDELEDAHAKQILLQSIKTLAEKGLGRSN
jgi:hypothetical protein